MKPPQEPTEPTLFRRPESRFWQARLSLPSGKRIRKSTGQRDEAIARQWLILAQNHIRRTASTGKLFPFES